MAFLLLLSGTNRWPYHILSDLIVSMSNNQQYSHIPLYISHSNISSSSQSIHNNHHNDRHMRKDCLMRDPRPFFPSLPTPSNVKFLIWNYQVLYKKHHNKYAIVVIVFLNKLLLRPQVKSWPRPNSKDRWVISTRRKRSKWNAFWGCIKKTYKHIQTAALSTVVMNS